MLVSQRIHAAAKKLSIPFNRAADIYALERLVARILANHELSDAMTFKGGFVLFKLEGTDRYTRDVDATVTHIARNVLFKCLETFWNVDLDDGVAFGDPLLTDLLIATGDYGGIRLELRYQLDARVLDSNKMPKLSRVHLDVGIGEQGHSGSVIMPLPSIMDSSKEISWRVLSLEYIFAEKLQTMVMRGDQNSRAKDIYDMWSIFKMNLDKVALKKAVLQVFLDRQTQLPESLGTFSRNMKLDVLQRAWPSVMLKDPGISFDQVFSELTVFLDSL
jgi:hypothetical protein